MIAPIPHKHTPAHFAEQLHRIGPWAVYETDEHSEPDCRKAAWFAVHQDTGETHDFDLSPYAQPTWATFHRLIEMGFPRRTGIGPMHVVDVASMWQRRAVERARVGA